MVESPVIFQSIPRLSATRRLVPSTRETSASESVKLKSGWEPTSIVDGMMMEQTTGTTSPDATRVTSRQSPNSPCESEMETSGSHTVSASLVNSHVKISSWSAG